MGLKHIFKPCYEWLMRSVPVLSPYGRKALKDLLSSEWPSLHEIKGELDDLDHAIAIQRETGDLFNEFASYFAELRDISLTLANLEQEQVLDEVELFEIKTLALSLLKIQQHYQHSKLRLDSVDFPDIQPVIKLLNPNQTISSSFLVYDSYSSELAGLRRRKLELESRIVGCETGSGKESLRLQRAEMVAEEKSLEYQVRKELSNKLKKFSLALYHHLSAATRLELLLAKSVLAQRWPSCRPEFEKGSQGPILVENALNPEIAEVLEAAGKEFCPVSIDLKPGVTVLTGANMGGKTVAMLTLAFNSQLARLGFYTFARIFKSPLLDFIAFAGGDSQNHRVGLSSFGAELINLSRVMTLIKKGFGLAIFDEFARSTNPCEGTRFVNALCEFLQQSSCVGLVATHYDGIDVEGASFYQVAGLKNHSFSGTLSEEMPPDAVLDRLCANMDYRLEKVQGAYKVPQDALHIAGLLGVDHEFLELLKKMYD